MQRTSNQGKIEFNVTLILFVLVFIFSIVFVIISPNFFTYRNLSRMISNQVIIGVLAVAITPLIIARGLDLSFGSCISLTTVIMAVLYKSGNLSLELIILVGFLFPVLIGFMNGLLSEIFDLNPLILTLGMGAILMAFAKVFAGGGRGLPMLTDPLYNLARNSFMGIPYPVIILSAIILLTWFILSFSKFGQKTYFLGANPVAAKLSGSKVKKVKILLYVYMGMATGIASILMVAFSGTGYPYHGENLILPVLSAVFLGGMTLAGGHGNIFNTILGVIIIAILYNGLSLLNLEFYFIRIIQGMALICIVTIYEPRSRAAFQKLVLSVQSLGKKII